MFDKYYEHHLIDHKVNPEQHVLHRWMYNFESERRRYVCLVELFKHNIYVVKYYAAVHSKSNRKYQILFNDEKPARIIRTCLNIMLEFINFDGKASFGFVAAYSASKKGKQETKANNQRYRIYKSVMVNFFGVKYFAHARSARQGAYLLINRKQRPIRIFKAHAEKMFHAIYRDF